MRQLSGAWHLGRDPRIKERHGEQVGKSGDKDEFSEQTCTDAGSCAVRNLSEEYKASRVRERG